MKDAHRNQRGEVLQVLPNPVGTPVEFPGAAMELASTGGRSGDGE